MTAEYNHTSSIATKSGLQPSDLLGEDKRFVDDVSYENGSIVFTHEGRRLARATTITTPTTNDIQIESETTTTFEVDYTVDGVTYRFTATSTEPNWKPGTIRDLHAVTAETSWQQGTYKLEMKTRNMEGFADVSTEVKGYKTIPPDVQFDSPTNILSYPRQTLAQIAWSLNPGDIEGKRLRQISDQTSKGLARYFYR